MSWFHTENDGFHAAMCCARARARALASRSGCFRPAGEAEDTPGTDSAAARTASTNHFVSASVCVLLSVATY